MINSVGSSVVDFGISTRVYSFPLLTSATTILAFSEVPKDDLLEGYIHIDTNNPFNVIVTQHKEGFPFIAMSYLHRINEEFKELRAHGKSALGHIMGNLDEKLPLLDA